MAGRGAILVALALGVPALGVAQEAPRRDSVRANRPAARDNDYWSFILLPLPTYNRLEGLGVFLTGGWRYAAPPGPVATGISIEPTALASTSGTRGAQLLFDEQGRWPGWRLLLIAGSLREQRAPYFGLGNRSVIPDNAGISYNSYSLLRTTALAAVRRRLAGPLHLLLGGQWRHYRARPLDDRGTKLGDDLAAGVPLDTGSRDGIELRGGLLFDTRDEESSPIHGVLVEAVAVRGFDARHTRKAYTRYALGLREFIPIGEFTSLAFRQSVELSDGHVPFYIADERVTSWRPEDGFGGITTLRAYLPGRFTAPNKALFSADLRYRMWDYQVTATTPIRLWLLAFVDVGRVWGYGERFAADHPHAGGGAGVRFQIGRGGIFGFDVASSPDALFSFTTALQFAY